MKEKIATWIAFRIPHRIAYWCFVRLSVSDGNGQNYPDNPSERQTGEVLKAHSAWAR